MNSMDSVNPSTLKDFLLITSFLLGIGAVFMSLFSRDKVQKREVTINDNVVNKSDCEKYHERNRMEHELLHARISSSENKSLQQQNDLRLEIKRDIEAMHNRLNQIAEEMPKRVIDLLDSTGKLK